MPTYAYRCEALHEFEVVQSIVDDALTNCPSCGAGVRRMVFPVGIVFKGQGFYKTDSRSSSTGSISPPKPAETTPAPASATAKPDSQVSSAPQGASAGGSGTGDKNG